MVIISWECNIDINIYANDKGISTCSPVSDTEDNELSEDFLSGLITLY